MINATDNKIMMALNSNGRYSYAKLAKELGVKPATVAKRVEALLNNDVISISAVPNPEKMGYKVMAVITLDVKLSEVDNVCAKLVDNPNISSISTTFGRFDIILFAEYRNLEMLYKLVSEEIPNIGGIKTIETFIISERKKRYQGFLDIDLNSNTSLFIDEIDEKLITELRKNGRESFTTLAEIVGVSPATVSRRVAYLTKNNVIKITVVPNPTKLGHSIVAFLGIQAELSKLNEICAQFSEYSQVPSVMTLMNGYNILALVVQPSLQELSKFVTNEIARIDGVINVETLIRAEFKKRTYLGFDLEERLRNPPGVNYKSVV